MADKDIKPTGEEAIIKRAKILTKPLPVILDEMDSNIEAATEAARKAEAAAKRAGDAAAAATKASDEAKRAGEEAADQATKAARDAADKAEKTAKAAIEVSERAVVRADESEDTARNAVELFKQLVAEASQKADEVRRAGDLASDRAAQAAAEIAAFGAFTVTAVKQITELSDKLMAQIQARAEETGARIRALQAVTQAAPAKNQPEVKPAKK